MSPVIIVRTSYLLHSARVIVGTSDCLRRVVSVALLDDVANTCSSCGGGLRRGCKRTRNVDRASGGLAKCLAVVRPLAPLASFQHLGWSKQLAIPSSSAPACPPAYVGWPVGWLAG